jgi:hypothetical protein
MTPDKIYYSVRRGHHNRVYRTLREIQDQGPVEIGLTAKFTFAKNEANGRSQINGYDISNSAELYATLNSFLRELRGKALEQGLTNLKDRFFDAVQFGESVAEYAGSVTIALPVAAGIPARRMARKLETVVKACAFK